jgi:hypothetical protein
MSRQGKIIAGKMAVGMMAMAVVVAGCGDGNATADGPATTQPTGTTSTTGTSMSTTPPTASSPTATETAGIPPGLLLPNEGEPADSSDVTAWETDDTADKPWLLDPCRPTDFPTDTDRTGFRTVSRTGPELFQARQLAVYDSESTATEAMAGFTRALTACKTGGDAAQGEAWQWAFEEIAVGDEGLLAASKTGEAPFGNRVAVTRVDAMVFLAFDEGEYGSAEIDEGARLTQQVAEKFVASL